MSLRCRLGLHQWHRDRLEEHCAALVLFHVCLRCGRERSEFVINLPGIMNADGERVS